MNLNPLRFVGRAAVVFALCSGLAAQAQKVKLATTSGDIVIELDAAKAPKTVDNFVKYVKSGHYDGTIFHRVIPTFMIQGGGMTADMKEKTTREPIPLESRNGLSNVRGSVAMARTGDPNSATAQFFINATDNNFLNFTAETASGWGYAVFAKVVSGSEVVDAIEKVRTGSKGGHGDVPLEDVVIVKASRVA
jgi:cyclophilin family peptidyl-prolyl cis-trans isomerase